MKQPASLFNQIGQLLAGKIAPAVPAVSTASTLHTPSAHHVEHDQDDLEAPEHWGESVNLASPDMVRALTGPAGSADAEPDVPHWESTPGWLLLTWKGQYAAEQAWRRADRIARYHAVGALRANLMEWYTPEYEGASHAECQRLFSLYKKEKARLKAEQQELDRLAQIARITAGLSRPPPAPAGPVTDWAARARSVQLTRAVKAIVAHQDGGYSVICWYPGDLVRSPEPLFAEYTPNWQPGSKQLAHHTNARSLYCSVGTDGSPLEQAPPGRPEWLAVFQALRPASLEEWLDSGMQIKRRDAPYKPPAPEKPGKKPASKKTKLALI